MATQKRAGVPIATFLLGTLLTLPLLTTGCTGGTESKAADEPTPSAQAAAEQQRQVDAAKLLEGINPAIPVYQGAEYRDDMTRRDEVMIRGRYGAGAQVYTLATDDSFPQVYHYYTTYLAQFRGFPAQNTYPPSRKDWRTLEVQLNQAMQDPFFPTKTLDVNGKQVMLQIAETEAEPKTVIRYIVTERPPAVAAPVATAANGAPPANAAPVEPVAR
ncbi:MAG TPA: hypothetical protein VEK57_24585 [Thermoanaerobaculia bacterium]|nr:hypothetical protein [Thermoanaerobaculia bacterium]